MILFVHAGGPGRWGKGESVIATIATMRLFQKSPYFSAGGLAVIGLAIGATAVGAMAIGAFAIRRLVIREGSIEKLSIGELTVDKLIVRQQFPMTLRSADAQNPRKPTMRKAREPQPPPRNTGA